MAFRVLNKEERATIIEYLKDVSLNKDASGPSVKRLSRLEGGRLETPWIGQDSKLPRIRNWQPAPVCSSP